MRILLSDLDKQPIIPKLLKILKPQNPKTPKPQNPKTPKPLFNIIPSSVQSVVE